MHIGLHVSYSLFFSGFNEIWIFYLDFVEILKYQFHENLFIGRLDFPCGQRDREKEGRMGGRTER